MDRCKMWFRLATQVSSIAAESLDYSEGRLRFKYGGMFCFLTP